MHRLIGRGMHDTGEKETRGVHFCPCPPRVGYLTMADQQLHPTIPSDTLQLFTRHVVLTMVGAAVQFFLQPSSAIW
jgi:hypothetical protein